LALKESHPKPHAEVEVVFEAIRDQSATDKSITIESGHGRIETRAAAGVSRFWAAAN
jgi:hypothetical protein